MPIEVLRPNAPGDETNIDSENPTGAPHYTTVNEEVPDDEGSYVLTRSFSYRRDLYNIDNPSVGEGTINKITVYAWCRGSKKAVTQASLKIAIKSGIGTGTPTTVRESSQKTVTATFKYFPYPLPTNPATGAAWTRDEIGRLQIGEALRSCQSAEQEWTICSQIFVEVDSTPDEPQFTPGEVKTAWAPIGVQPAGLSCSTELYLVINGAKVATSGVKPFTSTGAKQDIQFPVTMPGAGTYRVWLDIFAQATPIGAYEATEKVVVVGKARFYMPATMTVKVTNGSWMYWGCEFKVPITNKGDASGTYNITYQDNLGRGGTTRITLAPGQTYNWKVFFNIDFRRVSAPYVWELFGDWEGDNYSRGEARP